MELLHSDVSLNDTPESGVVSEEMLNTILDRSYLESGVSCPYPSSGIGYENVQVTNGNAIMLENIDNNKEHSHEE